ncbi:unnamed protein product [Leptosia nina]|uniref:Uncharacterized protein n=1 Tax=Leptosia nina TaxID=320188 RepID=A0AAV1JQR0_9NEOP
MENAEERRARNAQYERERRVETAEAMSELALALGCEPSASSVDILATAVDELQRKDKRVDPCDDIVELKRCNAKLAQQIEDIEKRLSNFVDIEGKKKDIIKHGGVRKIDKLKKKRALRSVKDKSKHQSVKESKKDKVTFINAPPVKIEQASSEDALITESELEVEPLQLDSLTDSPENYEPIAFPKEARANSAISVPVK